MNTIIDELKTVNIDLSIKPEEKAKEKTKNKLDKNIERSKEKQKEISKKELEDAVDKANNLSKVFNKQLNFSIHKETGIDQIVIKVIDTESNETLKEIPNTKFLDFLGRLKEAEGIIFDETI